MTNYTSIMQHAANIGNRPKKYIADLLEKSYKKDQPLSKEDIAVIYRYFTTTKSRKVKTCDQWVALACQKEGGARPYLEKPYQRGDIFGATDGNRYHYTKRLGFKEGYYSKDYINQSIDCDLTFPEMIRIIPTNQSLSGIFNVKELPQVKTSNGLYVYKIEHDNDKTYIQVKYLDEFLNGNEEFCILHYGHQSLHLKTNQGCCGVIMSVKM